MCDAISQNSTQATNEHNEKLKVAISVRRLAETVHRTGGLAGSEYGSIDGQEGIDAQKRATRYMQDLPEFSDFTFVEEHRLSADLETKLGFLSLRGRADLFLVSENEFCICECKSFRGPKMKLSRDGKDAHWAQALLYMALLALDKAYIQKTYRTFLVYASVEEDDFLILEKTLTHQELVDFALATATSYLARVKNVVLWNKRRDVSLLKAKFPYPLLRSGQADLMREVVAAMRDKRTLFAEAPTGIGKTMAVLYPSLKALASDFVQRIFYATAMTSTRVQVEEAIQILRENSLCLIRSIRLSAKEEMCLQKDLYCEQSLCPFAINYYNRLPDALSELLNYEELNEKIIIGIAKEYKLCPFELSLDIALYCDVIIGDYNHVFDPRIRLRRFFDDENPEPVAILIDEAHNLAQRSRSMYSAVINWNALRDFLTLWNKEDYATIIRPYGNLHQAMLKLFASFKALEDIFALENIKESVQNGKYNLQTNPIANDSIIEDWILVENFIAVRRKPDRFLKDVSWTIAEMRTFFDEQRDFTNRQTYLLTYFELLHFQRIANEYYNDSYFVAARKMDQNIYLSLLCLDASSFISDQHYDKHPVIFFSATLSPSVFYEQLLYSHVIDDPPERISLPSPFPKENRLSLVDCSASIRYQDRTESLPRVKQLIYSACAQKTGNYLVFVPSYAYLKQLVRHIQAYPKPENTDFMIQRPGLGPKQKSAFIKRFQTHGEKSLIAIAVLGGMFSEGIDLKGEQLSGVICVGVGLPGLSPERQILAEYSERKFGNGFLFAYVFPAFQSIQQASGRLIRSDEDKGFVLLIDSRWKQEPYISLLAPNKEILFLESKEDLEVSLNMFWKSFNEEK